MDQLAVVVRYLAATECLTIRASAGEHNPPDVGKHCGIPQRGHLAGLRRLPLDTPWCWLSPRKA